MSKKTIPHNTNNDKEILKTLEIVEGTGEILVDISARGKDRNWGQKKTKNVRMYEIVQRANEIEKSEVGFPLVKESTSYNIEHCGDWLEFAHYKDGSKKLSAANFCRHKFCPLCNWRKSLKLFGQVSELVEAILRDKKARFIFLTFTIRNVTAEELPDALDKMNEGFKWIFQPSKTYAPASKFKKNLMGYMKAVEITYNPKTDTYHPHIHAIGEVKTTFFNDGYINMNGWRELWKGAMHLDYEPQVDAKVIKVENGSADAGAVAEVAKYPIKVDGLLKIEDKETAAKALINLSKTTYKRRFVTFGGDFKEYRRRLKHDDIEHGDLVHVETDAEKKNSPVFRTLWKYNARFGLYIN